MNEDKLEVVWENTILTAHFNTPVLWKRSLYAFNGPIYREGEFLCPEMFLASIA